MVQQVKHSVLQDKMKGGRKGEVENEDREVESPESKVTILRSSDFYLPIGRNP